VIGFLKQVGKLFIENKKHPLEETAMNSTFKFKLIQTLNKKNANKGFTLIELLVVVIIIGVLSAIGLPALLNQVGKARQAEALTNLSTINHVQQAFRLENGRFGVYSETPANRTLPVTLQEQNYDFPDTTLNSDVSRGARNNADAKALYTNDVLEYSASVGQDANGVFTSLICESTSSSTEADAGDLGGATCTTGNKAD
jgi:prepilin-type N-terminal cleavage/methylation domain-containing protein